MVDQRKRFVGDDCFELILSRTGARDLSSKGFPAQRKTTAIARNYGAVMTVSD
jgi:hypothetical protein